MQSLPPNIPTSSTSRASMVMTLPCSETFYHWTDQLEVEILQLQHLHHQHQTSEELSRNDLSLLSLREDNCPGEFFQFYFNWRLKQFLHICQSVVSMYWRVDGSESEIPSVDPGVLLLHAAQDERRGMPVIVRFQNTQVLSRILTIEQCTSHKLGTEQISWLGADYLHQHSMIHDKYLMV